MAQSQAPTTDSRGGRPLMDDATLVPALQRGEASAVAYVMERHAPELYRFAWYHVQDPMLAEDIVSEVMMRMISRIDGYVLGNAPFQAWLFRIARNLIADHYRARKRRPQISLEGWLTDAPGAEPHTAELGIDSLPDREELLAGLAAITPEQRQVILLHVVGGWEMPQVAQLLDRSVPSVESLYYRGLKALRRALTSRRWAHGAGPG